MMNPDYEATRHALHDAYKRAMAWGVESWRAVEILMRAQAELEALHEERQRDFVRKVRSAGTHAVATRTGLAQRTVQWRFDRALNELRNEMGGSLRA